METKSSFDLKNEYKRFVTGLQEYHNSTAGFIDPEEMVLQFETRNKILGNISELSITFSNNSHHILEAFDRYKEYMQKSGVNINFHFFRDLTSLFIQLLTKTEDIHIWMDQLSEDIEYLEKNKVSEMTANDINKL